MDVNGDNLDDLVGGGADGVYVYLRRTDGTFEAPYILLDTSYYNIVTWEVTDPFRNPRDIGITEAIKPFIVDWNRDDALDLLFGDLKGHVYFYPGTGLEHGILQFGTPERITVDDEVLLASHGNAAPHVVDWDGDGNHDLLLGNTTGSVQFLRNTTSAGRPVLASPIELITPSSLYEIDKTDFNPDTVRGGHTTVCTFDWNDDGLLDLIVGTNHVERGEERELTLVEQAKYDEVWEIYDEYRKAFWKRLSILNRRARREIGLTVNQLLEADFETFVRWNKRVLELCDQDRRIQQNLKDGRVARQATRQFDVIDTWFGQIQVYLRKPQR